MGTYKEKVLEYDNILSKPKLDLKKLKKLCFCGIPDQPSLRSLTWKILLNYLPMERAEWGNYLSTQRNTYKKYVEEIIIHPGISHPKSTNVDHPLNENCDSQWMTFFKDNEVLLQINRDVRRLCPDISFFQQATKYSLKHLLGTDEYTEILTERVEKCILNSSVIGMSKGGLQNVILRKVRNEDYETLPHGEEAHWQVVERMLFVFAKLNPGIAYIQGMNEIIGPLYYIFASDPDEMWQEHAEEDTFFCFTSIMAEIRDNFIKTLDDSELGIGQSMNKLLCLLQVKDEKLWEDLEKKQLKPQFFAFRWITLLLSQEFNLPDVIRLWDSLFSDPDRFDFLLHVCCAMLVLLRDKILNGDFAVTIKLVQNFPYDEIDMVTIIQKAVELKSPKFNVAETASSESAQPTGRKISERGRNLKQRLSMLVRKDSV